MAIINVNMGVRLLNTPAALLGISCCPIAKRNAGKPLPQSPTMMKGFNLFQGILLKCLIKRGRKARKEIAIRAAPT